MRAQDHGTEQGTSLGDISPPRQGDMGRGVWDSDQEAEKNGI